MIELDDPEWHRLRHAYGSAADVPDLIRRLQEDPSDQEPWEVLWSALCHQFDVYEATFAAVPHLVQLMGTVSPEKRVEATNFVGTAAACAARSTAPAVPTSLVAPYHSALRVAEGLILESLASREWEAEAYPVLFGALAAVRGQAALAFDLFEAVSERTCPHCGAVVPSYSTELLEGEA